MKKIALLAILGYVCTIIGSLMYQQWFSGYEIRTMLLASMAVSLIFAPLSLMFSMRKNVEYGISDNFIIVFSDVMGTVLNQIMVFLPLLVLFAKITP